MPTKFTLPFTQIDTFLSATQLSEHYKLYEGYFNQANDLPSKINGISTTDSVTNLRGLQKTLQYALSGRELHEIYFGMMTTEPTDYKSIDSELKELINHSFGNIETFISDLKACAKVSRGWYRLELDQVNRKLYHNVGDFHDEGSTSGFKPILALDMYEHAYFFDYQTNKAGYIDAWFNHLNWSMAQDRLVNNV